MRTIYLSPHLDDAVLSAGGLIFEQTQAGMAVEIWSFMCGFPPKDELTDFAAVMHQLWGTGGARETVQTRREEDQRAAAIVGARVIHFDFLDCIYRRGKDGKGLYADVFVPVDVEDAGLPARGPSARSGGGRQPHPASAEVALDARAGGQVTRAARRVE